MRTLEQELAHIVVKNAIALGKIPSAKELLCKDCGDQASDYDHYLGYAPEQYMDVEPVCRSCHRRREYIQGRRKPGQRLRKYIGPLNKHGKFYCGTKPDTRTTEERRQYQHDQHLIRKARRVGI